MPLACRLDLPTYPNEKVRPSDEQVIDAYERLGSCRAAGTELGIAPQTVHKRLRLCGHGATPIRILTEDDKAAIVKFYRETDSERFCLDELSKALCRTRASISRYAGEIGLTRPGRVQPADVRAAIGAKTAERWSRVGHPKGMLGKKHSEQTKEVIGRKSTAIWATDKAFGVGQMSQQAIQDRHERMGKIRARKPASENTHSRAKGGRADDLGETWFRSSWERNYARYLNLLIKLNVVEWWDYEKEVFWFEGVRRGTVSYRPDFRVKYKNVDRLEYVEIKGWVTDKDRTKWKRMKKYHPHIRLVVVAEKEYRFLANRWASSIPNWEKGTRPGAAYTLAFGKQVRFQP